MHDAEKEEEEEECRCSWRKKLVKLVKLMRDICLSCPCYLSSSNDCASLKMFQALRNDQLFLTRCHVFDSTHPRFQRAFRTECDGLGIIPNPTWVDEDHAEHRGAPVWNQRTVMLLCGTCVEPEFAS